MKAAAFDYRRPDSTTEALTLLAGQPQPVKLLAGSLVAGMLGDWIFPFVYNVGFFGFRASLFTFLFLGGLVALARILDGQPPADAPPAEPAEPAAALPLSPAS